MNIFRNIDAKPLPLLLTHAIANSKSNNKIKKDTICLFNLI